MARLSHPEVITVYDVGSFGDQLFVAMEYIDGETLRRWRTARHRTVEETLAVYERAGSGLAAAHEAGLVHRDFKPDNVLVARDGRVRVTDFGLARRMDAGEGSAAMMSEEESVDGDAAVTITRSGALLGTPAYMAPEQLRGRPSDARSDVFSFCVSLYEALYGERPFGGPTVTSLCTAIERGVVRPPPITTRVPGWLRSVLLQGLRPSPEARFASMRALLDALRAAHAAWRRKMIAFRVVGSIAGVGLAMGLCSRALPLADRDNARGLVGVDERHGTPVVTDFRANHTSIPSSESPPPLSAVRIVESMPTVDADPATPRTRTAPRPVDARPIASRSSSAAREVTSPGKESRPLASPSARPLGHAADEPQVGSNGALIME
jgi:serine/threonine protein kinase